MSHIEGGAKKDIDKGVSKLNLIAVDCYGHPKKYVQKSFL